MGEYIEPQNDPIWRSVDSVTAFTPRRNIRVVTVGAGFSALIFAHKLQYQQPEFQEFVSHEIFECRSDIGGTWLVNRYPGVQCDVPAHIYAFPFDPKTDWTHFYATGPQIHDYLKERTKKWNLDRDVKLNHKVTAAVWQEEQAQWEITVEHDGRTFIKHADVLVNGQGVLNTWKWPKIEGFDTFKGHKAHSAAWDGEYDYTNKTIAVIGNGSSGVQIVPKLAELPSTKLVCFQKSANYVYTPFSPAMLLGRDDPTENPAYTEEDIRRFQEDPKFHRQYRSRIIHLINAGFRRFLKGSAENLAISEVARKQMAEKLRHDPELCSKLIPKWGLACRRITPATGYLEALQKPNVELVTEGVTKVTEDSVSTADGRTWKVDTLACATGFDVSLKPSWQMIGRNGVDLQKEYDVDPTAYLAVASKDMPNYFIFLGPNAVVAHGSLVEAINWTGDYILKWIKKMAEEDIKSIVPKTAVIEDLVEYEERIHQTLIWSDSCSSWFKRGTAHGRNIAAFGGSALLYRQLVSELRPEDFEIEYREKNRWNFLGNGFTDYEMNPENDMGWYIER